MTETRSVVVERDIAHPPEKIWRALTQPHLIAEWLMKNDFALNVGHSFTLTGDWGSVDCQVQSIEPNRSLAYSWDAMGLESVVTWTLTPIAGGTHLRMEQAGFRQGQEQAFQGARFGWNKFFGKLEEILGLMTPKEQIDAYIAGIGDWRGGVLAQIRATILAADPEIYEDWKWMGSPVWYRDGIIGVANAHKGKVKLTLSYGAFLPDLAGLFNAGLEGNERRAIDLFENDTLNAPALTALVRAAVAYNQAKAAQKAKPKKP